MDEQPSPATPLLGRRTGERNPRKQQFACAFILVAQFLERIAWYSLTSNLAFFLNSHPLCWRDSYSTTAVLVCTASAFEMGMFGGWLSDSMFSRYIVIIIGYVTYIIGYAYMPYLGFLTHKNVSYANEHMTNHGRTCNATLIHNPLCLEGHEYQCAITIYVSLIIISVGVGIVRINLTPFGADQVREDGEQKTRQFVSRLYWVINIGCLIANIVVVYIQQNVSFFVGYLIPAGCVMLSGICFLLGTRFYETRATIQHNALGNIYQMYRHALISRSKHISVEKPPHLIDYARFSYGGKYTNIQVEDVKDFWKLCLGLLLLLPYWICYSQTTGSVFLLQGLHLRLDTFYHNGNEPNSDMCPMAHNMSFNETVDAGNRMTSIPAASLAVFDNIFIILMVPLSQSVYGKLRKCGVKISMLGRMAFGMFLMTLALLAGGLLESIRLHNNSVCGFHEQVVDYTIKEASPSISVLWQIPQYALLGASEVFTVVTGIEYAYLQAPLSLHGLAVGLFWGIAGIGYLIGVSFPYVFQNSIWKYPEFINYNRMDILFYGLAGFQSVAFIFFLFVGKFYDLGLTRLQETTRSRRPTVQ